MMYSSLPHFEIMKWDIGPKYRAVSYLGHGSYGSVCKALRISDDRHVAIKKMKLYSSPTDSLRILREVQLLWRFKHSSIVSLHDLMFSEDRESIYLVLELADADLKRCINSSLKFTAESNVVQTILYNILIGVRHLHQSGVLHWDLKPANILIKEDCSIKICDFGLSRTITSSSSEFEEIPIEEEEKEMINQQ